MTTTNKLDLRTCPLPDLCEWVAVEIMGWKTGYPAALGDRTVRCIKGHDGLWHAIHGDYLEDHFRSIDAVAAVEREDDGRLAGWTRTITIDADGNAFVVYRDRNRACRAHSSSDGAPEPEARLRAVALAWEAAGKEGA